MSLTPSLWVRLLALALASAGAASCATSVIEDTDGDDDDDDTGGSTSTATASGGGGAGGKPDVECTGPGDCQSMADACNAPTCVDGTCVKTPTNEMGSCDDGKFCTSNDFCQGGLCVSGTTTVCMMGGDLCQVGSRNTATDRCEFVPGNDGAQCDDGEPCTNMGTCSGGMCQTGTPTDCSFLNDNCTVGSCDEDTDACVPQPANDGAACSDGLFCTVQDACAAGACLGVPNNCADPDEECQVGSCNEAIDQCTSIAAPNGTVCDDDSTCTIGESCTGGACSGGMPSNEGGACNDKNACTANDTCASGVCAGTPVVACQSGDGCCPNGCVQANDDDCSCSVNLGLGATPSISSGGSSQPYTPAEMNNGIGQNMCQWAWIDNTEVANGAWFQLDWAAPVTIGSIYIETEHGSMPSAICNNPTGRNIESGTVQYWDGASWVTSTTFDNQLDDVKLDLPAQVTTTKMRVFDVTTSPGNGNSIIYEWHLYQGLNCSPPP